MRLLGYHLLKKQPMALSIGSVVLRYIHIVEQLLVELYTEETKKKSSSIHSNMRDLSLSSIISKPISQNDMCDAINDKQNLKEAIKESAQEEIAYDITDGSKSLRDYGKKYINYGEVVLTYSQSHAVSAFLQNANRDNFHTRNISVIVCETFPSLLGQQFALELAQQNIKTTLIHDAAAFTVMPRCNKVVIGCHAVLANGGVLVPSGGSNLVMAASQFKVPVIVVTGMYKLYPQFCSDQSTINDMDSPNRVMPYSLCDKDLKNVDVINPVYDYIPPEYISLILTTKGGYAPSYIFRLMKECYSNDDMLQPFIYSFQK